jgi:GNAT superfamily N-acetyltransferase
MRLLEFTADDTAELETFVELDRAASAADSPWEQPRTVHRQEQSVRRGFDGERGRYFLIVDGDAALGTAALFASDYDNHDLAWTELVVRPDLRRRGYGRAALDLVLDECRSMGRTLVLLYGWESAASRRFAAAADFTEKSITVRRIHRLGESSRSRAEVLHDEALIRAGAYELVRVRGRTSEDLLPGLVQVTAAINDAPRDDLEYDDEVYDVDRIRTYERVQEESGYRLYRIVALERATGEVAGHSVVCVDAEAPEWGEQHDTSVLPAHRGNRLGLLLKSAMVLWLAAEEPQLRQVLTENAASNDLMVHINERLGYEVAGRQLLFQRRLD